MLRLRFEKVGNAVWMSHLDLMRLMQRAFKRAGLNLKFTQGFSPRAQVSIALPLSVGVESVCEILDFELVDQILPFREIQDRLNGALPGGVRVLECWEAQRKVKELTYLDCALTLEYDHGFPAGEAEAVQALLQRPSVPVTKHGKNGPVEQDIIPMIRSFRLETLSGRELELRVRICAQNPSLNPAQIVAALGTDGRTFDFASIRRLEVLTQNEEVFR